MEEKSEEKKTEDPESETKSGLKIKLKITKRKTVFAVILTSIFLLAVFTIYSYLTTPSAIEYHKAFALGQEWAFRADLRDAEKVRVEPSEDAVYFELFNIGETPFIKNITIAFKDAGPTENPYYQLQVIELVTKLKKTYELSYQNAESPGFNAIEVDSYYKLPGKIDNPIIALVHPKFATETSIKLENHVILLSAITTDDMDLVTAKLLMIALQLKPTTAN